MVFITDCLVLKIEEYEVDKKNEIDTTVYVLYDHKEKHYVVRGQRRNTSNHPMAAYSFNCINEKDLESFLSFVICRKNSWSFSLYNYDNLPYNSNNITYDFLQKYDSRDYEISGYDNQRYNKKRLIKNLKMLKNVFNNYN